MVNWDYLNLTQAASAKGMTQIDTVIAENATPYGAFYCQAISKFAPNPRAAELWEEFIYSDEGQLLFLKGFAHPARFAEMAKDGKIPQTLLAALPPAQPYGEAVFANNAQTKKAQDLLAANWTALVQA